MNRILYSLLLLCASDLSLATFNTSVEPDYVVMSWSPDRDRVIDFEYVHDLAANLKLKNVVDHWAVGSSATNDDLANIFASMAWQLRDSPDPNMVWLPSAHGSDGVCTGPRSEARSVSYQSFFSNLEYQARLIKQFTGKELSLWILSGSCNGGSLVDAWRNYRKKAQLLGRPKIPLKFALIASSGRYEAAKARHPRFVLDLHDELEGELGSIISAMRDNRNHWVKQRSIDINISEKYDEEHFVFYSEGELPPELKKLEIEMTDPLKAAAELRWLTYHLVFTSETIDRAIELLSNRNLHVRRAGSLHLYQAQTYEPDAIKHLVKTEQFIGTLTKHLVDSLVYLQSVELGVSWSLLPSTLIELGELTNLFPVIRLLDIISPSSLISTEQSVLNRVHPKDDIIFDLVVGDIRIREAVIKFAGNISNLGHREKVTLEEIKNIRLAASTEAQTLEIHRVASRAGRNGWTLKTELEIENILADELKLLNSLTFAQKMSRRLALIRLALVFKKSYPELKDHFESLLYKSPYRRGLLDLVQRYVDRAPTWMFVEVLKANDVAQKNEIGQIRYFTIELIAKELAQLSAKLPEILLEVANPHNVLRLWIEAWVRSGKRLTYLDAIKILELAFHYPVNPRGDANLSLSWGDLGQLGLVVQSGAPQRRYQEQLIMRYFSHPKHFTRLPKYQRIWRTLIPRYQLTDRTQNLVKKLTASNDEMTRLTAIAVMEQGEKLQSKFR